MAAVSNRKKFSRTRGKEVLRYPLKMFAEGTDYLQIDMLDYVPVGQSGVNQETQRERFITNPREGFRRNTNKQPLGTVLLPIPGAIQDRNAVNYQDDSMNSLVGAGTGALTTFMEDGGKAVSTFLTTGKFEAGDTGAKLKQAFDDSGLSLGTAKDLITKALAGRALSVFGGNVSLQNLVARSQGQIFNPNMELLFNSPSLRNFNFSFKMTPRSADEGEEIKTIIRFFKRGMAAKADVRGLYLNTPNIFELRYRQGTKQSHQFLHSFKQCFMTDISVNYTGEGVYATYENGTPVSIIMNLSFKEVAPIYDIDYDSPEGAGGVGY